MKFRVLAAFLAFIASYLPLSIILAVQDIPKTWWEKPFCTPVNIIKANCSIIPFDNPKLAISFIFICLLSLLGVYKVFSHISYPHSIIIEEAKEVPNELINYTFPYVVSFMSVNYNEPEKLLGFIIFIVWMFVITYKSGQIIMNPLFIIFGWRLYEAKIIIKGHKRDTRVLKKGQLIPGKQVAQTIQQFYISKD